MWNPVGTSRFWLVGKQAHHYFLSVLQEKSGAQTNMGTDNPGSHDKDVRDGGSPEKPGQDQVYGIHTGFHLDQTGSSSVQDESDGRRG